MTKIEDHPLIMNNMQATYNIRLLLKNLEELGVSQEILLEAWSNMWV